jgi:hypothetical protein
LLNEYGAMVYDPYGAVEDQVAAWTLAAAQPQTAARMARLRNVLCIFVSRWFGLFPHVRMYRYMEKE